MSKVCTGCNVCNLARAVRVKLSPAQISYLRASGAVDRFNQAYAAPMDLPPARLSSRSLAVARPLHLKLLAMYLPASDRVRVEARGVAAAMVRCLETTVFSFPMTDTDRRSLAELKACIQGYGTTTNSIDADSNDIAAIEDRSWPAWADVPVDPTLTRR